MAASHCCQSSVAGTSPGLKATALPCGQIGRFVHTCTSVTLPICTPTLIDIARRTGISAFVGPGANRWPAVHRLDAARLFRLALEKAAPGARLHGVAEEGVPMRAIAQTIGTALGLPVQSLTEDEALAHFAWLAPFVAMDNPSSSALTRSSLGWRPQGPELLTDMRDSGYFSDVMNSASAA